MREWAVILIILYGITSKKKKRVIHYEMLSSNNFRKESQKENRKKMLNHRIIVTLLIILDQGISGIDACPSKCTCFDRYVVGYQQNTFDFCLASGCNCDRIYSFFLKNIIILYFYFEKMITMFC